MLKTKGYFELNELKQLPGYPSEKRLKEGAVAVIECAEEIPCDPCEDACPKGAIKIGVPITNLPKLDDTRCHGCGLCISACPGQAIFVVDMTYSDAEATVQLPFELLPHPKPGDVIKGLNRAGQSICDVRVLRVLNTRKSDRTAVIIVAVPKVFGMEVRNIEIQEKKQS
ncbi:MAG: 4Fe-4S binding protein [Planctomycetes bacterium]|nr:4Fe-4S binding protein [Planctomycetota bacterium]